ncbi:hypothetical protein BJ742DRAFT_305442 [Cladochytrium replicatum]|nr:hypothetical protein BJ742DRAFT_305442 [Cladochytrium replicatum]
MDNSRMSFVVPESAHCFSADSSTTNMLLASVKAIKKLTEIVQGRKGYILSDEVGNAELTLSSVLGIPIYGSTPDARKLCRSRNAARKIIQEAGLVLAPGFESLPSDSRGPCALIARSLLALPEHERFALFTTRGIQNSFSVDPLSNQPDIYFDRIDLAVPEYLLEELAQGSYELPTKVVRDMKSVKSTFGADVRPASADQPPRVRKHFLTNNPMPASAGAEAEIYKSMQIPSSITKKNISAVWTEGPPIEHLQESNLQQVPENHPLARRRNTFHSVTREHGMESHMNTIRESERHWRKSSEFVKDDSGQIDQTNGDKIGSIPKPVKHKISEADIRAMEELLIPAVRFVNARSWENFVASWNSGNGNIVEPVVGVLFDNDNRGNFQSLSQIRGPSARWPIKSTTKRIDAAISISPTGSWHLLLTLESLVDENTENVAIIVPQQTISNEVLCNIYTTLAMNCASHNLYGIIVIEILTWTDKWGDRTTAVYNLRSTFTSNVLRAATILVASGCRQESAQGPMVFHKHEVPMRLRFLNDKLCRYMNQRHVKEEFARKIISDLENVEQRVGLYVEGLSHPQIKILTKRAAIQMTVKHGIRYDERSRCGSLWPSLDSDGPTVLSMICIEKSLAGALQLFLADLILLWRRIHVFGIGYKDNLKHQDS